MARTVNDIYDSDRMVIRKRGKNQRKEKKNQRMERKKNTGPSPTHLQREQEKFCKAKEIKKDKKKDVAYVHYIQHISKLHNEEPINGMKKYDVTHHILGNISEKATYP